MPNSSSLRFSKCINCDNESFSPEAHFCKNCGMSLYNHCQEEDSTCENVNPPDAFYCEKCGGETFLLQVSAELAQTNTQEYAEAYIRGN
ncbi:Zinc ribbon domain-containing protein [Bacillus manliponensis]